MGNLGAYLQLLHILAYLMVIYEQFVKAKVLSNTTTLGATINVVDMWCSKKILFKGKFLLVSSFNF